MQTAVVNRLCLKRLSFAVSVFALYFVPIPGQCAKPLAIQPRTVYQYSVIPGGVHTPEELALARKNDPVVAAHFADFGFNTRITALPEDMYVYISYRQGNHVFYTRKKHRVRKGEMVITDGKNYALIRGANRLETALKPGKPLRTPELAYKETAPAYLDVIVTSPPWQDFGTQPLGSTPATASITFGFSGASAPTLSFGGKDFSVGAASCNGTFTSCSATVSFTPALPGLRQDAITGRDASGNKQVVALVRGVGTAPRLAFFPGVICTFAGNGTWGYADSASPTTASFRNPQGIASDSAGNLYIADSINMVIRKIDGVTRNVTTVAGNGGSGKTGDGGPAVNAHLNTPTGIAVDAAGNIYIADQGNNLIRRVDALSGLISTVAGGGTTLSGADGWGDGLSATSAILMGPNNVAVDRVGNIYIADSFHNLIRKVTAATNIITVVAGGGSGGGSDGLGDGGLATAATLNDPNGIAFDAAGNLYVADTNNHMVRTVNASTGIISVVAGTGAGGYSGDGGLALSARVGTPTGVALDPGGNVYIADFANSLIRQVNTASGLISTLAAGLSQPTDLAFSSGGDLLIADYANNVIRKIVFTQAPLTFPSANVGTNTPASNVVLNNIGNADLSIAGIVFSAGFAQTPTGSTDCSTSAVPSGGSCVVGVVFAPTVAGAISGSLQLTTSDLNRPAALNTIPLTGTGTAGTPQANLSANSLTFASQAIGTASAAQTVTLTNPGSSALAISSIALTGANAGDFSLTTNCPASLAVSAACTSAITFKPIVAGARTATLIVSDSLASSPQTVILSGTGSGGAQVTFNPASASFGNVVFGVKSPVLNVAVTNTGSAALSIYGLALSGLSGADFSLTSSTCGSSLGASTSCSISLAFSPSALGSRAASLLMTDSAGDSPQSLSLSGTGMAGPLTVSPSAFSFGSTLVGVATAPQSATLSNSSGASIALSSLAFSGNNAADFSTTANNCVATLANGANCSISVVLTPSAAGTRSATLNLTNTASNSPQVISLSGSGTAPALAVAPAALSFGSSLVGAKSTLQSVTVSVASGVVTFGTFTLSGTNAGDFSVAGNTCAAPLSNGASCAVSLAFTPSAAGARSATLNLTNTASNSPQTVALSGSGTAPTLTAAPAALSFGSSMVGTTTALQTVSLSVASGLVTLGTFTLSGTNAADFSVVGNTCTAAISNGASCTVSVAFTPSAAGARSATLNFTNTAGNSPQTVSLSGSGTAPTLTVAPAALSFGSSMVGTTSVSQSVAVSIASGLVTFGTFTLSGTNATDFSITANTCAATISSGASCSVSLAFKPTAPGARSATLNFTNTAGNSPQTISLSGSGTAPVLTVAPTGLSFGSSMVGTTGALQSVTVSVASGLVTFGTFTLSGNNAADFSIVANTCAATISNGASCTVSVALTPSAAGARSATLNFTNTAGNSPQTISLSGSGTAPTLTVAPAALSFGSSIVGTTTALQTVTLSVASGLVTFGAFTLAGTNSTDFSIAANTCGATLGNGASCSVSVAFTPASIGARSATLLMTNSAANSPQSVSLAGTGAPVPLTISVTPSALSFGSLAVGAKSSAQSVTLTNTAATSITLNGFAFSGSNSADFSLASNTCGATLAPGSNCAVSLAFAPSAPGSRSAALNIADNAVGSPQSVSLSGTAVSTPAVTLSSSSLNFGSQSVGVTTTQTLTVTNSGSAPLSVTSLQLTGANASEFTASGCAGSVAASGTCIISVTFDPLASGSRSATLSISDNAAGSPQTVSLSGTGSSAAAPTAFTTYLGTYGSGAQTFNGASVILPLRAYLPGGAAQLQYFWANLNATSGGATEFQTIVTCDGAGNCVFRLFDGTNTAPAWPYLSLTATGSTISLATPITLGSMQITAYRFALAGNEFQLDLSLTHTGTFSDQIIILASYGQNYSSPWYGVDGRWSNP